MLQRVKDIRYSEIKNWKPIVSLRESYQKETNSFLIFCGVGVFVLLFLGVIWTLAQSGDPTGKVAQRENEIDGNREELLNDSSLRLGGVPKLSKNSETNKNQNSSFPNTGKSALDNNTNKNTGGLQSPVPGVGNENSRNLIDSRLGSRDRNIQQTQYAAQKPEISLNKFRAEDSRVGVIDVYKLFSFELRSFRQRRMAQNQTDLNTLKDNFQKLHVGNNESSRRTQFELMQVAELIAQKKSLFVLTLKAEEEIFLAKKLEEIMWAINEVSEQKSLEVVVRHDKVMAFSSYCDITRDVEEQIRGKSDISKSASRQNAVTAGYNTERR